MDTSLPWLVVIDLQPAFFHVKSPWWTPAVSEISEGIATLLPAFGERVVFTRFVPPERPSGSWRAYYDRWPFAMERPESDPLWTLEPRWDEYETVASHTFSKWVPALIDRVGPDPTVVLCGVSTDCCVLMTALAAVDDGAHLRVVADLCVVRTARAHEGALAIMASRAPQLAVTTLAEERGRAGANSPAQL